MSRIIIYPLLCAVMLLPALALACRGDDGPESVPVTLPTALPTESARPLSASDLMQLEEFATQQQAIDQDWDRFHREFDAWRNGLTACTRSSVEEALQGFAVGFGDVTAQARNLPRSDDETRDLADMLIAAAEAEETAYRQLRDEWQPDALSLFELVEENRADSARAHRMVEDEAEDLLDGLEDAADPVEIRNVEEISVALAEVTSEWRRFNDEFDVLLQVMDDLEDAALLSRVKGLVDAFDAILEDVNALADSDALGDKIENLKRAAHAESAALLSLHDAISVGTPSEPEKGPPPIPTATSAPKRSIEAHLEAMNGAIGEAESMFTDVDQGVRDIIDGRATERIEHVHAFLLEYETLLLGWGQFHQGYNQWRSTNGGCDEGAVLDKLAQFRTQISEVGHRTRDLPQSGYLLPAYGLLVEAADKEEGAIRALQNTWRPYTVDAFVAVDRERSNATGLRREADTAVQELRSRAAGP